VAAYSVFAIGYNTADSSAYLLPAYLAVTIWLGIGAATGLESWPNAGGRRWLQAGAVCALAATILFNAILQLPHLDASQDQRAEVFGRGVLAQAPAGALIFTQGDRDTFTLWYFHFALKARPDVAVVVEPLLDFAWYRDNLRRTYPALAWPREANSPWREAIVSANPKAVCDAQADGDPILHCAGSR
jgi:hypothetical protein